MKNITVMEEDLDMLYPAGVKLESNTPEEVQDILYPAGVGPAGEDTGDEDILLPLMDK